MKFNVFNSPRVKGPGSLKYVLCLANLCRIVPRFVEFCKFLLEFQFEFWSSFSKVKRNRCNVSSTSLTICIQFRWISYGRTTYYTHRVAVDFYRVVINHRRFLFIRNWSKVVYVNASTVTIESFWIVRLSVLLLIILETVRVELYFARFCYTLQPIQ